MLTAAPRIVNDVSYVMWINHEIHFAWQAQHLVTFMFHFLWQVQHLVTFMFHFLWQVQPFGEVHVSLFVAGAACGEVHVSLFVAGAAFGEVHVSLFVAGAAFGEVHVSLFVAGAACVKFGMIGRSGNVVIFNRICSWRVRKVASVARRVAVCVFWVGSWSDHGRIMVGSWSDHSRIGRALEMTFHLFSANFCLILGGHFAWQAKYLVQLEGDACCSAHCKMTFHM